jgi:hypothetical protein
MPFSQRTGPNVNDDLDTPYGKLSPHEVHCARQRLAQSHAALFPTRMALARLSSSARPMVQDDQPQLRLAWYARIGRDHQAWLDRGGFAQHDDLPPLRQPTMWHPPRLASPLLPQATDHVTAHLSAKLNEKLNDQFNPQALQHPSCRPGRDDDTRQCGSMT